MYYIRKPIYDYVAKKWIDTIVTKKRLTKKEKEMFDMLKYVDMDNDD